MRNRSYLMPVLGILLAGLVSCNKQAVQGNEEPFEAGMATLNVQIGAPQTKVGDQAATNESKIQNVQVFVFRAGDGGDRGNLEIAVSKGFEVNGELNADPPYTGITVKSSTGSREIWVVVNDSEDRTAGAGAVSTKEDFLRLTHDLQFSSSTKLLMIGHSGTDTDPSITLTEGTNSFSVQVKRYAASVILESVKNDFASPAYQKSGVFRVENAYLLNVPGRINFGHTSDPAAYGIEYWYAKRTAETDAQKKALIYDTMGATVVEYGQSYSKKHTFYTYPNPCAASEAVTGDFSPRATLLVVEASIRNSAGNWQLYYYPVLLSTNPLESNKQYRVNLTIHRPGSLDPNIPVKFADMTSDITVGPWEAGDSYTPEV